MSNGNLVLHPADPTAAPPADALTQLMAGMGLIGNLQPGEDHVYFTGERFLQLITFLGCSPFVRMEPKDEDDIDYCHIRLLPTSPSPQLLFDKNTRPPRCPHCNKGDGDWLSHFSAEPMATAWKCPGCGQPLTQAQFKWRHQAGYSRLFVVIPGIFPNEAVPLPELLNKLAGMGGEWDYFYTQEPQILSGSTPPQPLF
ncbi:MAG: hypothetical protein ABW166_13420 [Sedimenticola sp.]